MIEIEIKNIRSLNDFKLKLPLEKGLFAIAGENGTGKSTIFSCLSKLVYRAALQNYFRRDGDVTSRITYKNDDVENSWIKKPNWKRDDNGDSEILIDGFYEGSLIFGSRFADTHSSKLRNGNFISDSDLIPADEFVKENLGLILRNNKNYYSELMKIRSITRSKELGFNGNPYFIKRNGQWISQLFMSSGELLLIGLLHFINERVKLKKKRDLLENISLMLIDEVELALHPSAQQRLGNFLEKVAKASNFCVYFSTHSVQIINIVKPDNLFYINRAIDGSVDVVNPCYPAYATRSLYSNDGYDLVILVEDDLAKLIVEKIIRQTGLSSSRMIRVVPCGGWEKTLELQHEMKSSYMLGQSCEVISILDGDIKESYDRKYDSSTKEYHLKKLFLPIYSVEKFLKKKLIDEPCVRFAKDLGDSFFIKRSIEDIVNDYKTSPKTKNDNNGKGLFRVLTACAEDDGCSRERFKTELCAFLLDHADVASLSTKLEQAVA